MQSPHSWWVSTSLAISFSIFASGCTTPQPVQTPDIIIPPVNRRTSELILVQKRVTLGVFILPITTGAYGPEADS